MKLSRRDFIKCGGIVITAGLASRYFKATLDNPSSLFSSFWSYSPSAVEWMVSAGLLAAAILAFVLLSRILPIIPNTKVAK